MSTTGIRIAPLKGLDLRYYRDEAEPTAAMRGGFNVRVVDSEWWLRPGLVPLSTTATSAAISAGSIPWTWFIDSDTTDEAIIACPTYALKVRFPSTANALTRPKYKHIYSNFTTATLTFTIGSATATLTSGTVAARDMLLVLPDNDDWVDHCYVAKSVAGSTVTLDRVWAGPTSGSFACKAMQTLLQVGSPLANQLLNWVSSAKENRGAGSAVLFYQSVSSSTPAMDAGHTYLVIASSWLNQPVAIDLDVVNTVRGFILWDRSSVTEAEHTIINGGYSVAVSGSRLVFGIAEDTNNKSLNSTIWTSAAADLTKWYFGTQGQTTGASYITFDDPNDPILSVMPLGEMIVVYRRDSQVLLTPINDVPYFAVSYLRMGYGLASPQAICQAPGGHFFMSHRGPVFFDGQQNTLLKPDFKNIMDSLELAARCQRIGYDMNEGKIYFLCGEEGHQDDLSYLNENFTLANGATWPKKQSVFVFEMGSGNWWLESHAALVTMGRNGINTYGIRPDGVLVKFDSSANSLYDPDNKPIEAYAATSWYDFGTLERKELVKIFIDIRVAPASPTLIAESLVVLGNFNIYSDMNAQAVRFNQRLTIKAGDFSAVGASVKEGIQQPGCFRLVLTPRISGYTFKFEFHSAQANISEFQSAFRVSAIEAFYSDGTSTRPVPSSGLGGI